MALRQMSGKALFSRRSYSGPARSCRDWRFEIFAVTALLLVLPTFSIVVAAVPFTSESQIVTLGSVLKLRHVNSKHLLSSSEVSWGFGSGQQIVTAGPGAAQFDQATHWIVKPADPSTDGGSPVLLSAAEGGTGPDSTIFAGNSIKCGATIRLEHAATERNLHSHSEYRGSLASQNFEVCGFGKGNTGDYGDIFEVDCLSSKSQYWRTRSLVGLKHVGLDRFLFASATKRYTSQNCPECPMIGHLEVSVLSEPPSRRSTDHHWQAEEVLMLERDEADEANEIHDEL